MRLINADKLYEQTAVWEAAALENVKKHQYDYNLVEWNKWSTILAERTTFKYDVAAAPTVDAVIPVRCGDCVQYENGVWYIIGCCDLEPDRYCSWGSKKEEQEDD